MKPAPFTLLLCTLSTLIFIPQSSAADYSILHHPQNRTKFLNKNNLKYSLKNYCESWRINVELNNIQGFEVVPQECTGYIGNYLTSTQYDVDIERAVEQSIVYLSRSCKLEKDGNDAWIFDVDDTLLSTIPYFRLHSYGGEKVNLTCLEEWMSERKAPALKHTLELFHEIKSQGIKIILISSRREKLRSATIDNLVHVGFHGWANLILRGPEDEGKEVQRYKAEAREQLIKEHGYRIWGIVGDQWSSFHGFPMGMRTFKLPNPLYYVH